MQSLIITLILNILQYFKNLIIRFLKYPKQFNGKKKWFIYILYCFFFFILYIFIVDINLFWLFGKSPKIRQHKNPDINIASELYSSDGKLLCRYYTENRTLIKYEELPDLLIKTLIATEDKRFYYHNGIDYIGSFSVLWDLISKREKRGGSTITQQLVKNLFKTRSNYSRGLLGYIPLIKTIIYKTKEWISALKLELYYSKAEIITMYFNTISFGSNTYGIYTASKTYFNKKPSELKAQEIAVLIGMLKAPTYYSPYNNPVNSLKRRNVILGIMYKENLITEVDYNNFCDEKIKLKYKAPDDYDGKALFFKAAVAKNIEKWLDDNDYDINSSGLKIYTTLDSKLQEYAEEAMLWQMKRVQRRFNEEWQINIISENKANKKNYDYITQLAAGNNYFRQLKKKYGDNRDSIIYYLLKPKRMKIFTWTGEKDTTFSSLDSIKYYKYLLQAGFLAMEPHTGHIKAWVGGGNYKYFKYDHIYQSKRQPGSTFKAFVYTAAFENNYGPCDKMTDRKVTIVYKEKGERKIWAPNNADWVFTGEEVSLKYAFAKSINSIAVQITEKIGWKIVIEYANKLGINSELADVPSVCLGSSEVTLYELLNSYCPLVNGGFRIEPIFVTKILDKNNNIIYINKEYKKRVISEETAFLMSEMLKAGLTEPGGTTQALWEYDLFRFNTDLGGKTGTSSKHSDGWFIGISPELIGGSWVGADNRSVHFRTSENGEGCKTALPLYAKFMEKLFKDNNYLYYRKKFQKPNIKITKNYTCHTYHRKKDSIPNDSTDIKEEQLP
ncbi:MAG: transglycosylase domain-containing protein [Bacteroidales bacterium]|nr:transglycosylase domain-containing protein [Bacteroidales bacterium]